MKPCIFTIILTLTTLLQGAWLVPEADVKLSAEMPLWGRQFLVPVPKGIECASCLAFDGQGTPLPASVVPNVGIRLDLTALTKKHRTGRMELYLCKGKHPKEVPNTSPNKVKVTLVKRPVTTRAFTAQEIERYFGSLKTTAATDIRAAFVSKMGELSQGDYWKFGDNPHACHAIQWETVLHFDEATSFSFGTKQPNTAWAILANGMPMADWTSAEQRDGAFMGKVWNDMPKGTYTIQLLSLLRRDEAPPEALILRNGKPEPITGDAAPNYLPGFTLETKDKPEETASFFYNAVGATHFTATDETVCQATVKAKNAVFIDLEGKELKLNGDTLLHDAWFRPGVRLGGKWEISAVERFHPAQPLFLRARISKSPLVIPHNAPLECMLKIDAPETAGALLAQATLVTEFCLPHNTVVEVNGTTGFQDSIEILSRQEEPLAGRRTIPFSLKAIPPKAYYAQFRVIYGTKDVLTPARLYLIRPHDAEGNNVQPIGNALSSGSRATLVCNPFSATKAKKPLPAVPTIAVLDAFSGASNAPKGILKLEDALKTRLQQTEFRHLAPIEAEEGATTTATLLAHLYELLQWSPGKALLVNGLACLLEQEEPLFNATLLLFMVQACLEQGVEPILVCLPPLPGLSVETARLNALYTKEIAVALGLSVIDLYSRQLASPVDVEAWYSAKGIASAVPSDNAINWLADQIAPFLLVLKQKRQ
ncbi:MAG: hypothetical protein IJT83_09375 [Victivallales bacterium]|nr:hypothetical protein [Victivallales bacterium]